MEHWFGVFKSAVAVLDALTAAKGLTTLAALINSTTWRVPSKYYRLRSLCKVLISAFEMSLATWLLKPFKSASCWRRFWGGYLELQQSDPYIIRLFRNRKRRSSLQKAPCGYSCLPNVLDIEASQEVCMIIAWEKIASTGLFLAENQGWCFSFVTP